MPLKDGILYIDKTNPAKPVGISMSEIARCIGVGSQDLGTLAGHRNNNKWSWCKPVRYKERGKLEREKFAIEDISFGFDMVRIYGQGLKQLFDNAKVDGDWIYLRPQGGINSNPFRTLMDYDGYNHYAKCPIDLTDNQKSFTSYAPVGDGFTMPFKIKRILDAEIQITDFGILTGSNGQQLSSWRYGVAYRASDNDTIFMALGDTLEAAGENVYVPITFTGASSWQLCFVATTEAAGDTSGTALYTMVLPKGYTTFILNFKRIPVAFDVSAFTPSAIIPNKDSGELIINTSPFDFWANYIVDKATYAQAGNVAVTGISGSLKLVFYAYNSNGDQIEEITRTFDDALNFNPSGQNYNEETMTESFYTNLIPVLGDSLNLGDFGGKLSSVSYITISFQPDAVLTKYTNTYLYTSGEPMGGFKVTI